MPESNRKHGSAVIEEAHLIRKDPIPLPSCCLMILNYNGRELLADCLPSALRAAEALGRPCPVVVVDNCSTDGDVGYIHSEFPSVEIISAERNDFLFSFNDAVAQRDEEVVILLNNDMTFDRNFIEPLLHWFERPYVFAVTARVLHADGETGIFARSQLERRKLWYSLKRSNDYSVPCYSLYASGGAGAYRRSSFLELDGFDPLFRPGYYEEVDLSYRAWKRGWRVIFEPTSTIAHRRSATFTKHFDKTRLRRIILRNQILFNVKDCGGLFDVIGFLLLLPIRLVKAVLLADRLLVGAVLTSLPRLPLAFARGLRGRFHCAVTDRELMALIDQAEVEAPPDAQARRVRATETAG